MIKKYNQLPALHLAADSAFYHPPAMPEVVHLEDPAIKAMFDLKIHSVIAVGPDAPIPDAATAMRVCHSHFVFVTNREQHVIGLLSSEDILGEKPLQITMEKRIRRTEISVRMLMLPQERILAIDLEELKHAKVGNVITTLHALHQHYALVVELQDHGQVIRGVFSLYQISKQLGEDVTFDLSEAQSVYELQQDLKD